MDINSILQAIQNISNERELRLINSTVVGKLKMNHSIKNAQAASKFKVGDAVMFDAKTRGIIRGTIIKFNPKTVVVRAGHVDWKVSPSLLDHDGRNSDAIDFDAELRKIIGR